MICSCKRNKRLKKQKNWLQLTYKLFAIDFFKTDAGIQKTVFTFVSGCLDLMSGRDLQTRLWVISKLLQSKRLKGAHQFEKHRGELVSRTLLWDVLCSMNLVPKPGGLLYSANISRRQYSKRSLSRTWQLSNSENTCCCFLKTWGFRFQHRGKCKNLPVTSSVSHLLRSFLTLVSS